MPEFLNGVEQGGGGASSGGLTTVADVTVTGGAVTEFGDTITLVDGGVYEFTATCIQNGAGASDCAWLFDSDQTASNYQTDRILSAQSGAPVAVQANSTFYSITAGASDAANETLVGGIVIRVVATALHCQFLSTRPYESVASSGRYQIGAMVYDSGTLPTQIGVLSSLASGIANGSTIKGVRLY